MTPDIASASRFVGLEKLILAAGRSSLLRSPGWRLDLGGIAKEYAADRAAAVCALDADAHHGLVNLGGDIAVIGAHPDGSPWRIGIRDPFGSEGAIATLFVSSGGIATSGDYERYWQIDGRRFSHLIDPRDGLARRRLAVGDSRGGVRASRQDWFRRSRC